MTRWIQCHLEKRSKEVIHHIIEALDCRNTNLLEDIIYSGHLDQPHDIRVEQLIVTNPIAHYVPFSFFPTINRHSPFSKLVPDLMHNSFSKALRIGVSQGNQYK